MEHTQGSWEIKEAVVSSCGEGRTGRRRQMMSLSCQEVWESSRRICTMVNQANAHLISAAPDLLEALKQIVWKVDQTQGYQSMRKDAVIDLAREAIAKTEGENPKTTEA